jgi:hypothetical protein
MARTSLTMRVTIATTLRLCLLSSRHFRSMSGLDAREADGRETRTQGGRFASETGLPGIVTGRKDPRRHVNVFPRQWLGGVDTYRSHRTMAARVTTAR